MQILIVCNSSFQNVVELPGCPRTRAESFLIQLPTLTRKTETKKRRKGGETEREEVIFILGVALSELSIVE